MRVSTERCTAWTSARNWATYHLQQEQYCPDVALSIMPDQCQKLGSLPLTQLVSRNNTVQLLHCSTSARNWAIYSQVRNNIVCPTVTVSIVPDQCQKLGHLQPSQEQHCLSNCYIEHCTRLVPEIGPPTTDIVDSAGTTLSNSYTVHWAQLVPEIGPPITDLAESGTLTALCPNDKLRKNSCIWSFPLLELSSGSSRSTRVLEVLQRQIRQLLREQRGKGLLSIAC